MTTRSFIQKGRKLSLDKDDSDDFDHVESQIMNYDGDIVPDVNQSNFKLKDSVKRSVQSANKIKEYARNIIKCRSIRCCWGWR